ncbi:MAG: restriction endonuclease subunit S [Rhodospirillales bacterium]|jgi:type I restriction enzyme, S subunit|nr:restriction endonuclease subunit S [Rhodospirillales bacterium]
MNADQLLAHYEQIADAPDAIARLRRFILDLAVRGKLVEQAPADEPASELLKRIAAEKARLVKAGKIKKKAALDPMMADAPHELPENWGWVSLGTVFLYDAGAKREPKSLDPSQWLLELEDIEKETGRLLNRMSVADRESKSTKSQFQIGDILYGKLRPYLTKVLVADEPGYSTTEIVAIRPIVPLCSEYCALALRRPDFVEYVTRLGQGTKMPRLRTEDAVVSPFPLPPLAEQHRITAKVDELMALCDRLEAARVQREATRDRLAAASLARLNAPDPDPETFQNHAAFALDNLAPLTTRPDQIKALRQTILNLAVHGKLVEQDPADEPASALLKRIAGEKAERVAAGLIRVQKPLEPVESNEREFGLPGNWVCVRLGEVVKLWNGLAFKSADFGNEGIPVVRIGDLQDGAVSLSNAARVPQKIALQASEEIWIPDGALLLAMSGATTGKTAFNTTGQRLLLNQRVGRIEPFQMNIHFIRFFFETIVARNLSISLGTAIPNLSAKQINETAIPLPPLAEQHRIVAKVDELMALCDRLEASLATADTTRQRLLEALLHEALTPGEDQEAA